MAITKVSEITNKELADYLKLEFVDISDVEKAELDTLLNVAKSFIRSNTGIHDTEITDEIVGVGDGITSTFFVKNIPVIPDSQAVYVDDIEKKIDIDYSFSSETGAIKTVINPSVGAVIKAGYKIGLDAYPDFVIVVYVLVQDMYDNRTLYVDKNNLNKVVDTILGMHSINLL